MQENDNVVIVETGVAGLVTVVGVYEGGRDDMIEVLIDGTYHLFGPEELEVL